MRVVYRDAQFKKEMRNLINYANGFLEGAKTGKNAFFHTLGKEVIEVLKQYVDSNARANPNSLHHVYEWYQTGSPDARLFDIQYTVSGLGLSFRSTFTQSQSIKKGSNAPFVNKATLMQAGVSATIRPRNSDVLVFEDDGQTVFTRSPVYVSDVGGQATTGSYEAIFDEFFNKYFTQAFFYSSGIAKNLSTPVLFKQNFAAGVKGGGRGLGKQTGFRWIANAGMGA